jgi:predicted nucleotidyltransferase
LSKFWGINRQTGEQLQDIFHAKWRIDFARQLAKSLLTFDGIKAIVIAGSVACDYADEYSDVEIPIFWETLPEDATRRHLAYVRAAHTNMG